MQYGIHGLYATGYGVTLESQECLPLSVIESRIDGTDDDGSFTCQIYSEAAFAALNVNGCVATESSGNQVDSGDGEEDVTWDDLRGSVNEIRGNIEIVTSALTRALEENEQLKEEKRLWTDEQLTFSCPECVAGVQE